MVLVLLLMTFLLGGGEKLHVTSCGLLSRIAHVGVSENAVPLDLPGMPIMRKLMSRNQLSPVDLGGGLLDIPRLGLPNLCL